MIGLIARPYRMFYVGDDSTPYAVPGFPGSNLMNNDYGRVAMLRTGADAPAGAGAFIRFDLGSMKPVDVIALLWHNLPEGYLVRVQAQDEQNNVLVDFNIQARTGTTTREVLGLWKMVWTTASPITARYWNIGFPLGPNRNFQFSRLVLGRGAKFTIGPQKASLGAKDMNANVTTEVGETRSQEDPSLIRPVVSLSFEYGKQSEMEQVLGQYTLSLGVSKPMLICTDLTSPYIQDNTAFGRPEKVVQLDSSIYDVWSFEAVVPSLGV